MRTCANDGIVDDPERRRMFLNGVREKVQDGIEYNIANGVCGEALGHLHIGWTLDTHLSFWKPFYDEKYIYQLNYGHFV